MKLKIFILTLLLLIIGALGAWRWYFNISQDKGEHLNGKADDYAFNLPANPDNPGWLQTSGPLGGTVIRMINYKNTLWASLYSGGIYELQNDGAWKQIAIGYGIPENRAFDIVVNMKSADIAYVPETVKCIAKTVNGGNRWTGLCDTMPEDIKTTNFSAHTLALDPADPRIVYAPGNAFDQKTMLLVSSDSGRHWEKRYFFDKHYDFNHLFFFNNKMYLGTQENGVFVSTDKGKHWTPFNNGLKDLSAARFVNFKNNLYLLGAKILFNTREAGGLYRLSGDRSSWEMVGNVSSFTDNGSLTGIGTDGNVLFVGTNEPALWRSGDGATFTKARSQGLPQDWIGEITSLDSKIYVGVGGNGIFISSDNGENFEEFNQGMISVATREVHVNPQDENELYAGTWDRLGFYWSKNGGNGYKRMASDVFALVIQPNPADFSQIYIGGDRFMTGTVSKEGSNFTEKSKPGTANSFIKSIGIDPKNFSHVLAGVASAVAETPPGEGLWESHDQGGSWTRASGIGNFAVYSIIFNPNDQKIVYASALGEGVFKSTDGGSHFEQIGGNQLKYTYRLAMSPTDPKTLVASSNLFFGQLSDQDQYSGKYGGIFQSRDGGVTWKELTAGIRNYEGGNRPGDFLGWLYNFGHMPNYENVLIDPKNPDHLVVGHHGENVVTTRDGGKTWEKSGAEEMVPGGIHNYAYCVGASSDFNKIYACSCGRGLFSGVINKNGEISWDVVKTVYAKELTSGFQAHNAEEAKKIILSGEYNHKH